MKQLISKVDNYNKTEIKNIYDSIKKDKKEAISKVTDIIKIKQKIIGEDLLMKGLEKFYNINYNNIKIKINEYGKPYILNNIIYYNISHSYNYIACAFSNMPIGIDIEKIRKTDINVIYKFANKEEIKYILEKDDLIYKRMFEIYCLKEAYLKMLGKDLRDIMNVTFNIKNNCISCNDKNVNIKLLEKSGYIIAICERKKDN